MLSITRGVARCLSLGLPWVVVLCVLLVWTGCSAAPKESAVRGDAPAFVRLSAKHTGGDTGVGSGGGLPGREYRMGSPDRVSVSCDRLWALNVERLTVRADGTVELPMLGVVKVAGLTASEASEALTRRVRVIDRDASINLTVTEFASRHIYVFGQVARPGAHEWANGQTLLDVLARVRVVEDADTANVEVVRPDDDGVLRRRITVDADQLIAEGDTGWNIALQPGDVVIVPGRQGTVPAWLSNEPAGESEWALEATPTPARPTLDTPVDPTRVTPLNTAILPVPRENQVANAPPTEPLWNDRPRATRPGGLPTAAQPVSAPAPGLAHAPDPGLADPFADVITQTPVTTPTPTQPRRDPEGVVFWN